MLFQWQGQQITSLRPSVSLKTWFSNNTKAYLINDTSPLCSAFLSAWFLKEKKMLIISFCLILPSRMLSGSHYSLLFFKEMVLQPDYTSVWMLLALRFGASGTEKKGMWDPLHPEPKKWQKWKLDREPKRGEWQALMHLFVISVRVLFNANLIKGRISVIALLHSSGLASPFGP